jgi:DNA-binding beta-propeller fold protein YncE
MKRYFAPNAALAAVLLYAFALPVSAQEGGHASAPSAEGRLFFLDIRGRVYSANPDGSGVKVLLESLKGSPDGIAVDEEAGLLYWSNMGRASADDGSIERADLNGNQYKVVVPPGGMHTAKQLKLDKKNGKLYWSDREGMRVMRSNIDGSKIETLVEVARGDAARADASNWCVGLAVDVEGGKVYWTQKGPDNGYVGSIRRANLEIPKGQTAANRRDIEVLFDGLPEPIDLDLDLDRKMIYWTDRGDAPKGNNVSRAPMKMPKGVTAKTRTDQQVLVKDLQEGIGVALDVKNNRMFVTDLRGNLYSAALDGSNRKVLGTGLGSLTGIAYADVR